MGENQKIALVTGAGSGIGQAVVMALYKEGWTIVLVGRREKPLLETAKKCNNERVLAVPTDITDPKSVQHLFAQTEKVFGRLDLLFNNAGIGAPSKPLEDLTLDEWQSVIDTEFDRGLFYAHKRHSK